MDFQSLLPSIYLAIPVAVFVAVILLYRASRRSDESTRKFLADTACPDCGTPFGTAAALKAQLDWNEHVKDLQAQPANQGMQFRLIPRWPIECPKCHYKGSFLPLSHKLEGRDVQWQTTEGPTAD